MIHTTGNYYVCLSCIDCKGTCQCKQSEFYGVDFDNLPKNGCRHFLSRRKWAVPMKKKRRKKWPTMAEFEYGY